MTYPVFPSLPGQAIGFTRTPLWRTGIQSALSGKEVPIAYMSYPLYQWSVDFDALRTYGAFVELDQMIGFVNSLSGMAGYFLFQDVEDCTAITQQFGIGDGTTTAFQLTRAFGGYTEPVQQPVQQTDVGGDPTFTVYNNGVAVSGASLGFLGGPGVLSFNTAPAAGHILTWSGSFRFLCRMLQDNPTFTQEFPQAWSTKGIKFQSKKL